MQIHDLSLIGLLYATNRLFATIYEDEVGDDRIYAIKGWLGYVYDNFYSNTEINYDEFIQRMHPFLKVYLTEGELEALDY